MGEGNIVLAPVPQANGQVKTRPALVLRTLPPFGDLLICGLSSQLHQHVAGFDEIILPSDPDFASTGLKTASLVRLGFLTAQPRRDIRGFVGAVSPERHERLLRRLSDYLVESLNS